MKPEKKSQILLSITRAKAKMFEYKIPSEDHINISENPNKLFTLSIGLLGDFAAAVNRGEIEDNPYLSELKKNLHFSAYFFDSYVQSQLDESIEQYVLLLGAASYYLCDSPGASLVLIEKLKTTISNTGIDELYFPNLNGEGLDFLLFWILESNYTFHFSNIEGAIFGKIIEKISKEICLFFSSGNKLNIEDLLLELRESTYLNGSARHVLLSDIICAVIYKKLYNSSWECLPKYSLLSKEKWLNTLKNKKFIKEFWPAQHLLGKADVLKGKSAIIQMPTSAGKTKATELIIRSAFLTERASLAIVIAPFRALCNEMKNSLIDTFNTEIKVDELTDALQC